MELSIGLQSIALNSSDNFVYVPYLALKLHVCLQ